MMTERQTKTRMAIYARVSTGEQDFQMQVEDLRRAARQRGWEVMEVYSDTVSGATESRPGLDRMMQDAKSGRFDVVGVWRMDRLGRSLQHLLRVLDDLQHAGVGFIGLKDAGIDTTSPHGRLLVQLLGAFAEFERSLIRMRVVSGLNRAKARGIKLGRPEREVDVVRARKMIKEDRTQRQVAMALRVPRTTLRRALARV